MRRTLKWRIDYRIIQLNLFVSANSYIMYIRPYMNVPEVSMGS